MRRRDREMPAEFALMVLDKCAYATLATTNPDGTPYSTPITIVREGACIYFHGALHGKKADNLRARPTICLSCVGETKVVPAYFTTEFESAVVTGIAQEVTEDEEKIHALRLLAERYTPDNMLHFDTAVAESLSRTAIWKITITEISGKRKKYDAKGVEMKFGRME
ncbi:MAG: 5-nitroimidazole antibiotic resistance protein [Firmicutes bacterium]|nr:5-nitroimidazole antibiotic resistance protein [Bacillota bacterium]